MTHSEIKSAFPKLPFSAIVTDFELQQNGFEVLKYGKTLSELKEQRREELSKLVGEMFIELDWRVVRAEEREKLSYEGETVPEVLREREAVRVMSNRLESEIDSAATDTELMSIIFQKIESDWPTQKRLLTQYAFRSRISMAEKIAMAETRKTDSTLDVIIIDLDAAAIVDLDNQDLINGLSYIASIGILTEARVAEILS